MSYGGYGYGPRPPGPYGPPGYGPAGPGNYPPPPGYPPGYGPPPYPPGPPPAGPVNTLATLSVVFAFLFAPVGAVLGHLALAQINRRPQRGRTRAIVGTVLSYVFIALGVLALLIGLVLDASGTIGSGTTSSTPTSRAAPGGQVPSHKPRRPRTKPSKPRGPSTTSTPAAPPEERPTTTVDELNTGDCVELQEGQPDPDDPDTTNVKVYRVTCEIRDGIYEVIQIVPKEDQCPDITKSVLYNAAETVFACMRNYGG